MKATTGGEQGMVINPGTAMAPGIALAREYISGCNFSERLPETKSNFNAEDTRNACTEYMPNERTNEM